MNTGEKLNLVASVAMIMTVAYSIYEQSWHWAFGVLLLVIVLAIVNYPSISPYMTNKFVEIVSASPFADRIEIDLANNPDGDYKSFLDDVERLGFEHRGSTWISHRLGRCSRTVRWSCD